MMGLSLGLDLGTSGVRSAVLDDAGNVISSARATYPKTNPDAIDAIAWWDGAAACLDAQMTALRATDFTPHDIARIGVDGTSGSMVLCDDALVPVSHGLMYNSGGFDTQADVISALAPDPHITRGAASGAARALYLIQKDRDGTARHLLHQADFIAAKLMGQGGYSDHNNALKTGFDPDNADWPDWFDQAGLRRDLLPEVHAAGSAIQTISAKMADRFSLARNVMIHVGTTDSIAAFLAAAPLKIGAAVTSIGTTLAVKMLSPVRIDAPEIGLYSHRLGDGWLVGGASNTGGGVLASLFSVDQLNDLSDQIDPSQESALDYYPLQKPGERFPINDPHLAPKMTPRPTNDAEFLHGLLESIARIEAKCYAEMAARGAPTPISLVTAGGGASNEVWTAIRARVMGREIGHAVHTDAAIGTARLIASQAQSAKTSKPQ